MPGDKGFESDDTKFQPAKLSDRKRESQREGNWNELNTGNTYGMPQKFAEADKVTKETNGYAGLNGEVFNDSEKNSSDSRLILINKQTSNSPTAYNGESIPETYKCATSNGVPNANAVEYKTVEKDRNA